MEMFNKEKCFKKERKQVFSHLYALKMNLLAAAIYGTKDRHIRKIFREQIDENIKLIDKILTKQINKLYGQIKKEKNHGNKTNKRSSKKTNSGGKCIRG